MNRAAPIRALPLQLLWNPLLPAILLGGLPQVLCWPLFQNERLKVHLESADIRKTGEGVGPRMVESQSHGLSSASDQHADPARPPKPAHRRERTEPARRGARAEGPPAIPMHRVPHHCPSISFRMNVCAPRSSNPFRMNVCITGLFTSQKRRGVIRCSRSRPASSRSLSGLPQGKP